MTVNQIKMIKQPAPDELKNDNKTVVHLKFYTNNNNNSNKLHVISRKSEQKHPDGMYILETNYWYGTWHEHNYQYKTHTLYLEDVREKCIHLKKQPLPILKNHKTQFNK